MKIKCPCCEYRTIDAEDEVTFDICDVCMWQYDEIANEKPDSFIGANKITLNQGKENYKKYGVSKLKYKSSN